MTEILKMWGHVMPGVSQEDIKKAEAARDLESITPVEWAELNESTKELQDDSVEQGIKHDTGKLPMDLIPAEAERMEAEVLAHGLKYGSHNWRGGLMYSRLIASLMRHFNAWRSGEELDQESGLSHMAHVRAISGFLCTYIAEDRHELDNRYRREVKK